KSIAKLEDPKSNKASSTPSTTSRTTRPPVTANTPGDNNNENIDVSFIEATLKGLAKHLKGKDIKKMVLGKKFEISLLLSLQTRSGSSIVPDVMTHSYSSLWCRRCYVYDCKLHGTDFRPSGNKKRPRPPISKNKPCGANCYLHLKEDSQDSYMADRWDDVEIALFEKAGYLMGVKNYCSVATIVMTKTCEQIFRRFQSLGETDKDDEHIEIGSSSDDARKKGKKMAKMEIDAENHSEYHPCDHPGRPCDSACPCRQGNVPCEKYCHCELDCPRRFPGCNCTGAGKCCSNRTCVCFANYRECDPDLCSCTASEPLTAQFMGRQSCKNVAIQRALTKRTIVGKSTVAGWGLFVREQVKKNEYLGEYIGEVISQAEADRRGKIYDKRGTSFLFNLNKDFVVDATRKGNKFRFINHSNDPNAFCRVTLVNGEHRIGIYAMSDLEPGQELFFDYRYIITIILITSKVPENDDVQVVELQVPSSSAESSASPTPSPAYSIQTDNNNDIIESEPMLEHLKDETTSTDNNEAANNGNTRFSIFGSIKKQTTPVSLPIVTDGVFSNLSAKPDTEANKDDENPPSYETAAADATPPYWETTIIAPGLCGDEILVEGLPVGNFFSFIWNMLVSMSFQFVGFLLTYLLHTNHAAKNGSRAGLGITLVQYGFYLRGRSFDDDGVYYNYDEADLSDKELARRAWLSYILMFLGWFIVIRSVSDYIRVKRMETIMRTTPEESV
ncbi:17154_t:CDS:10, partial [Dentiscutata heterogama]